MKRQDLEKAFITMLSDRDWDLWATITSRKPTGEVDAKRRLKHFLKCLNAPNRKFYDKYIHLWAFFEKNPARDGVHIHALIKGIDRSKCHALEDRCRDFWGLSTVAPMHKDVLPYLARKYAHGNRLEDFDFMKINSKVRKFEGGI